MDIDFDITCQHCGSKDYYLVESGIHIKANCQVCKKYIKFIPQGKPPTLYFGKYKGREISSMKSEEEIRYLQWAYLNLDKLKPNQKEAIKNHLTTLNRMV